MLRVLVLVLVPAMCLAVPQDWLTNWFAYMLDDDQLSFTTDCQLLSPRDHPPVATLRSVSSDTGAIVVEFGDVQYQCGRAQIRGSVDLALQFSSPFEDSAQLWPNHVTCLPPAVVERDQHVAAVRQQICGALAARHDAVTREFLVLAIPTASSSPATPIANATANTSQLPAPASVTNPMLILVAAFAMASTLAFVTQANASPRQEQNLVAVEPGQDGASLDSPLLDHHACAASSSLSSSASEVCQHTDSPDVASERDRNLDNASIFTQAPADSSIATSTVVPMDAKIMFPLLVVTSITLFLTSNLSTGAAVNFQLSLGTFSMDPYQIFAFSLGNTIHDMLQAKVYALALLVLVWSGMWPYLKLVLMTSAWYMPTRWLPEHPRGIMLNVLDALGKWCMIDIFLLLMMTVAFRFHISSSTIPNILGHLLPEDFLIVDVTVAPHYGIFGFVIAAMLSLVTNHMAIAFHRNASNNKLFSKSMEDDQLVVRLVDSRGDSQVFGLDSLCQQTDAESIQHLTPILPPTVTTIVDDEVRKQFCCPCPRWSWFDKGSVERALNPQGDQHREAFNLDSSVDVDVDDAHTLSVQQARKTQGLPQAAYQPESLYAHVFDLPVSRYENGFPVWVNQWTWLRALVRQGLVTFLLVASLVMILWGTFTESFQFEFVGIAGQLIEVIDPGAGKRSFSMISIATALAEDGSGTGVVFLQSVYLLFAFIFPLMQIVFLFAIWLSPMTLRDQKILFYFSEIVSAWASIDVFIVSIIASVVEINQFAQFLIGGRCDIIEAVVKEKCFGVVTVLLPGCWMVVAAAVLLLLANHVIFYYCEKSIKHRESAALSK